MDDYAPKKYQLLPFNAGIQRFEDRTENSHMNKIMGVNL